jgi:hypothetical protein
MQNEFGNHLTTLGISRSTNFASAYNAPMVAKKSFESADMPVEQFFTS